MKLVTLDGRSEKRQVQHVGLISPRHALDPNKISKKLKFFFLSRVFGTCVEYTVDVCSLIHLWKQGSSNAKKA